MVVSGFHVRFVLTLRSAQDSSLRFHASPLLPHRGDFRACAAAKMLPRKPLNPRIIFPLRPVLLTAPNHTFSKCHTPANALPLATTSRTRVLRSDHFPVFMQARQQTPRPSSVKNAAWSACFCQSANHPRHLIRPRPSGFITWRLSPPCKSQS